LKDKIKNHKNFDKKAKKTNKKLKEERPNWNKYYYYWKKNHKFDFKVKIKNYKFFDKRAKEKKQKKKLKDQINKHHIHILELKD